MNNNLTVRLKQHATVNSIDLIGTTSVRPFVKNETIVDPKELLNDARSIVVTGFYMKETEKPNLSKSFKPTGRFSSSYNVRVYTTMEKYHIKIIKKFLKKEGFNTVFNQNYRIPDKLAAVRAGLGKYGKNSLVVTESYGSCVMFVTIVTNAPLDHAEFPTEGIDCGSCDLCIRSCPTRAITAPYKVNRKLCITDWLWGSFIPVPLREKQENRLFGCGDCVRVCPKNRKLEPRKDYPAPMENVPDHPELIPLITADKPYFNKTIASFPRHAGIEAIRGNAIIAAGNAADLAAVEPLGQTLNHGKPQIRAYSAWALGRIGGEKAEHFLRKVLQTETKRSVMKEIEHALHLGNP